jgi:hypothetical protein
VIDWCPLTAVDMLLAWPSVQVRWARSHGLAAAEELPVLWLAADRNDYALMQVAQRGCWPLVAAVSMHCHIVAVRGAPIG